MEWKGTFGKGKAHSPPPGKHRGSQASRSMVLHGSRKHKYQEFLHDLSDKKALAIDYRYEDTFIS